MAVSKLSQVLTLFEEAQCPLTMREIARRLDVSPAQLDGMLHYWVRKNHIREVGTPTDCGTCSSNGRCPFVMEMPRSYELVTDDVIPLDAGSTCGHKGCNC